MLEQKIKNGLVTMALAFSAGGCGATLQHLDTKTEVWYECSTNASYPEKHPCYQVIQNYLASKKSSYSSSSSSNSSDRGDHDRGDRDNSKSDKSGHYESPKGGHWEKPK